METVEKKPGAVTTKRFHGDASKVVAKGNGLKKAFVNRPANFTVEVKDAGMCLPYLGYFVSNRKLKQEKMVAV